MPDQHPASTSDARKRLRCGLCGDPARGYATIGDTRYCHEGDDPTCYQKAQKAPETHTGGARGSECSQCDVLEAEVVEYGMCASCLHDARRSGWEPGGEPLGLSDGIAIHVVEEPKRPPVRPCDLGRHRWAWRVDEHTDYGSEGSNQP